MMNREHPREAAPSRRSFLSSLAAGPAVLTGAALKFNVLLIAIDDLRPELGCYGNKLVHSPNMDRLASRGVRFERAYCQYPLCNPSRTSLLTGRYPTTVRVLDNNRYFRTEFPDLLTLPQLFRQNGYVTARAGKIYHGVIDDAPSWDEGGEPVLRRRPPSPEERARQARDSDRWEAVEGEGEDQPDYRTASRAIELLEKYKDRPFFLGVGFVKPHSPLVAPRKYFELYDAARMPLPADFAPRPTLPPKVPAAALQERNGDLFIGRDATPEAARQMIRAYYACVSFMDAQLGRVLDKLESLGLAERTVVVLFSDHGYHLGEKGKWSKHNSLYEVAVRVPLLIVAPGLARANTACPRTVELVDLYPTLAELCGLKPPAGLEGESLVPLLRDPRAAWNHPAYTVTLRGRIFGRSVRTERYRYTEWDPEGTQVELYDHQDDPGERRNLAGEASHAAVRRQMRELLRKLPAAPS
ncbi:MAG: sulfatase [Bryobacterales bacterium]|nr:sulfatase [Bryobacteraceae bacterium]MDW8130002.1 sulfatase [Bryobacterales bacterium]